MKKLVKKFLFHAGLIRFAHWFRNRKTLTIIMLHRILPQDKITEYGANPEWTMTPEVFDDFLKFATRYYTPVSVEEVDSSLKNCSPLPDNALLITFDDGWRDNYQHASKYLKKHHIPALFFIVTNTINQRLPFWQELIFSCCTISNTNLAHCVTLANLKNCNSILTLISELSNNEEHVQFREQVTEYCKEVLQDIPRQLMNEEEILELHNQRGFTIGSHGASHNLLGNMTHDEQKKEIFESRDLLEKVISAKVKYLSFPHGSNNQETVPLCQQAGIKLMFDSRVAINKSRSPKLARIHVSQRSISDDGKLDMSKAAYRLFFLPHI